MSYLVLARKWRPQRFSEVVGQDHVTLTLKKAVEKNRLAHAYLFAGPRGCGKTTTARILAKVINCESPDGSEPCNRCASCKAVNEGRHLDVIEIDGASNRGIDEIRDLREKIGYAPTQGKSKIYIIDEVHMLTPQAFNALLKTLEEPPSHVYLVFATTEPQKVPATILSRCQRFNFKRLELPELVGQLEKICRSENIGCDRDALVLISRSAEGSMRDAESILDQCISAADGDIDLGLVRRVLGLVEEGVVIELLTSVIGRDRKSVLEMVDRVVSSGMDVEEFFLTYVEGLRNLLVLKITSGKCEGMLDLTSDEVKSFSKLTARIEVEDLLYLLRHAIRVHRDLRNSSQPRYLLEAAFAEAASWDSAVEISEVLSKMTGGGGVVGGAPPRSKEGRDGAGNKEAEGASAGEASSQGDGPYAESDGFSAKGASGGGARRNGSSLLATSGTGTAAVIEDGSFARVDGKPEVIPPHDDGEDSVLSKLGGKENWEKFLSKIRESKLTLGIWLMSASVEDVEGDSLVLGFAPQNRFAREMLFEDKNRRYIEHHLEKFFGKRLILKTSEDAASGSGDVVKEKRRSDVEEELAELLKDEPVIKKVIEEFGGELYRKKGPPSEP